MSKLDNLQYTHWYYCNFRNQFVSHLLTLRRCSQIFLGKFAYFR